MYGYINILSHINKIIIRTHIFFLEFASSKDSSQQESSDILTDVSKDSTPPKKAMSLPTPYRVRGSMHGKDTRMSKSDSYRTPKRVKTSPTVDRSISKPFWLQYPKRSRYKRRKPVQPEGGFGWVVCFTSFCTNGIVLGSLNTFSIFHVEILKVYGKDDSTVYFKTGMWHHVRRISLQCVLRVRTCCVCVCLRISMPAYLCV